MIVPFRNEKLIGVVTALSALAPADFEACHLEAVLDEDNDDSPLLSEQLLTLAEWIAQYYLAPLGEVLRGMLPLMAEVRRTVYYRITDLGRDRPGREPGWGFGTSRFTGKTGERIGHGEPPGKAAGGGGSCRANRAIWPGVCWSGSRRVTRSVSTLRTATAASLPVLAALVRKK